MNKNTRKIVREVLTNCCIWGCRNLDWLYLGFVSEAEEIDGRQKAAPGKQIGVIVPLADMIRGDLDPSQILVQMQLYSAGKIMDWSIVAVCQYTINGFTQSCWTEVDITLWQLRFMESLEFCINVSKKLDVIST